MRGIDAVLVPLNGDLSDLSIAPDGDIATEDAFDTFITVALMTDQRADPSEMGPSERRRGWIGNEHTAGFEMGSKLWILVDQPRLTGRVINEIQAEAVRALQSLVDEGFAEAIRGAEVVLSGTGASLVVLIERDPSQVEKRFFQLWENTGV